MPNTPVAVGAGVIQFCGRDTRRGAEDFQTLLAPAGLVDQVDEGLIDAACAVSDCGPAFCALLAEALADGAVACGCPGQGPALRRPDHGGHGQADAPDRPAPA